MGDMCNNNNNHHHLDHTNTNHHNFPASSTSALSSSSPQDEFSLFLSQILLSSSSSSPSSPLFLTHTGKNARTSMAGICSSRARPDNVPPSDRLSLFQNGISVVDASIGVSTSNDVFLSSSGTYTSANMKGNSTVNMPSSFFGAGENEFDEYDCESEEGFEALVEEQPAKSVPPRSSSKRSRAAEVHNLSEKRRRCRINEKMKALQNLIPNSNKTDKASMLDEAIEYLKQLQLRVQMLSMRNGLSLHPMCFTEGLQAQQFCRMGSEIDENPLQYVSESSLSDKPNARNQPLVPSPSYIINSETSFGLESPILPFQPKTTPEMRSDEILQHQQLNASHSDANPLGGSQVLHAHVMQAPEEKDKGFETGIAGKDELAMMLRNSENNGTHTSRFSR